MRHILALMAVVTVAAALAEPQAPAGVHLPALLRSSSPSDLQASIDGIKSNGAGERWARARLCERDAEVLSAAGLVGAAGEAAARGLKDCGADDWEVAARLHLMLARFIDELGPDRRDAYDDLRGRTAEAEIEAAEGVVKKLGEGFGAKVLAAEVEDVRSYRTCRSVPDADPDKLLGPVAKGLGKMKASATSAAEKAAVARALCNALNDYADACRRKGNRLYDVQRKTAAAEALLKQAVGLFAKAADAYADVPNPSAASRAVLLQNRALAMVNLGEVMLYATNFDAPRLSETQRSAVLKPVREAVPPKKVTALLDEALRLSRFGRPSGKGQPPPATHLHWVLLQNLAQAIEYEVLVTRPDDPTPSLQRAERLARRSADELEGLGLYLQALDAISQEARALELDGRMVDAVLVYLHGIDLCERAVVGMAPTEGGEYRRTKDAMFGRLMQILQGLKDKGEPFPEELLGEWGSSWAAMEAEVADLCKARTFADLVEMGAVWRGSKVPLIARYERLRREMVRMQEREAGGSLDQAGQRNLAQMRAQEAAAVGELAAGADRGFSEAMARTRVGSAQVQSVLRPGEVVVAYYLWHDVGEVEVLGKTGPPVVVDLKLGEAGAEAAKLLGRKGNVDLGGVVDGLVETTRDGLWPERTGVMSPQSGTQPILGKWPRALNLLYRILVEPVEARIAQAKTVILVPDGVLHYVPFEALIEGFGGAAPKETDVRLPAGTKFWGMDDGGRTVAYLPTAGSLYYLRTRAAKKVGGVGVVARPRYPQHAEGDPYQQAVARLARIDESVATNVRQADVYVGEAATPDAARKVLEAPVGLAVFGCHGDVNWRYPLASCLMLAPEPGVAKEAAMRDGQPLDLAQAMTLRVAAPVVFLAACQTGQAAEVGGGREAGNMGRMGDDLLSLSRGFMIAGTSALVTSLWECDPGVTVDFWQAFRKAWMVDGLDVGEAVAAAKRKVIAMQTADAPYATPTWWAGFEVQGDPACRYAR